VTAVPGQPFRVLIVDDEPAARRGVVQLLEHDAEFAIIGECATGEEMVAAVERADPDLLFLDVQMPGLDGFAALARLPTGAAPLVVFVTGYDRYAVRAFEARAIDYLLKPYSPDRFRRACDHAKQRLRQRRHVDDADYRERLLGLLDDLAARAGAQGALPGQRPPVRFLVKKTHGRAVIVPADAVLWIEARRDYVRLHTADGHHLIRDTLGNVERQLEATRFLRVHRSAIVRVDGIAELRHDADGKVEVVLKDGTRHPVSASGRRQLQEKLGFKA
jgi:two-component system LytT family response regulator